MLTQRTNCITKRTLSCDDLFTAFDVDYRANIASIHLLSLLIMKHRTRPLFVTVEFCDGRPKSAAVPENIDGLRELIIDM